MKYLIAPLLVLLSTLISKRIGSSIGGWLIALPLTSAPAAYLLATNYGYHFAHQAIISMMLGTISQVIFAIFYYFTSNRSGPTSALIGGVIGFALTTFVLNLIHINVILNFLIVISTIFIAMFIFRAIRKESNQEVVNAPRWDLPLRVITATLVVVTINKLSPHIGAHLAGLLSPFPVLAAVLTYFTHLNQGRLQSHLALKGLVAGLLSPAIFFFILALTIEKYGLIGFVYATFAAITLQIINGKKLLKLEGSN